MSKLLPIELTSFIGRQQEIATVKKLLCKQDVRLLTLTGPGGSGKTRLALQVATKMSNLFTDGVYFVDLALIRDPVLVTSTIAQALDLKETTERSLRDQLKIALREKRLLLLLDNFEQVINAAPLVVELLLTCPKLKIIVTSRSVLHMRGEQEFVVPPLVIPDCKNVSDPMAFLQYEVVALFLSRAQSVKYDFQVTPTNAAVVAAICARLDGLPLAIELAAAYIKLLSPEELLVRLSQRLGTLTCTSRNVPVRQRTLHNTITWSYQLLTASEQRVFLHLSVFVGGCTLEAIEASWATLHDGAGNVLEDVASLLDKSLLQRVKQDEGEPRFTMLETIREYGLECLHESTEAEITQRAHALYYLAFMEEAEPHLKKAQKIWWWKKLEREQGNLLAALIWLIKQEEGELASHLRIGWKLTGLAKATGNRYLERVVSLFGDLESNQDSNREIDPIGNADCKYIVESIRTQLYNKAFDHAVAKRQSLMPERALTARGEKALPPASLSVPAAKSRHLYPGRLTVREIEVLRLVAQGLTDAQVAKQLVISPHTVNTHMKSIYGKIQVTSRSAATRYAIEHQLL